MHDLFPIAAKIGTTWKLKWRKMGDKIMIHLLNGIVCNC